MADPIKTAKHIFEEFLSKADPASMPDYDPNAKDTRLRPQGVRVARWAVRSGQDALPLINPDE
jgi:hypothetical protein